MTATCCKPAVPSKERRAPTQASEASAGRRESGLVLDSTSSPARPPVIPQIHTVTGFAKALRFEVRYYSDTTQKSEKGSVWH